MNFDNLYDHFFAIILLFLLGCPNNATSVNMLDESLFHPLCLIIVAAKQNSIKPVMTVQCILNPFGSWMALDSASRILFPHGWMMLMTMTMMTTDDGCYHNPKIVLPCSFHEATLHLYYRHSFLPNKRGDVVKIVDKKELDSVVNSVIRV